jgi:hypothetical protein
VVTKSRKGEEVRREAGDIPSKDYSTRILPAQRRCLSGRVGSLSAGGRGPSFAVE